MPIVKKTNDFLEGHRFFTYFLVFILALIYFGYLQFSFKLTDPDSYYHIKISELMAENGVIKDFPYLPLTVLKDHFIDHHFLYHVYLMPFVKLFPPIVGAKIGHTLLVALAILAFFWLLRKLKVKGAFWYIPILFLGAPFVFRLSLIKAQPLSLIILCLGLGFLISKNYRRLFLVAFIYVWSYGGWILLPLFSLLYAFIPLFRLVIDYLSKKLSAKSLIANFWLDFKDSGWQPLLVVFGGSILGLIINPYFPQNIDFYRFQIFEIGLKNYQYVIPVGNEWYPYLPLTFFKNSILAFLMLIPAGVLLIKYRLFEEKKINFLLFIVLFFLFLTMKSRRNIEYFIPLAVIFSAVVYSTASKLAEFKADCEIIIKKWHPQLNTRIGWLLIATLAVCAFFVYTAVPYKVKQNLTGGNLDANYYLAASNYLKSHTQAGELIFHDNFGDFPPLFYHNDQLHYLTGLDPTFFYLANKKLFEEYRDLVSGKTKEGIDLIMKNGFGVRFVLVSKENVKFNSALEQADGLSQVYSDGQATIYQVL